MQAIRAGGVGKRTTTSGATATAAVVVPTLAGGGAAKFMLVQSDVVGTGITCSIKFGDNAVAATLDDMLVPLRAVPLMVNVQGFVHTDGLVYYSIIRQQTGDATVHLTPLDG